MSGHRQNQNPVAPIIYPGRFLKTRKRQARFEASSASSQKYKWSRTSHTTDEMSSGYSVNDNRKKHLASTQRWRELLFNNEDRYASHVRSEEIFRENIYVLLNGIDECAEYHARWSKADTNTFYNRIISFVHSWKIQLLKESTDIKMLKRNLENKRDLITNRLNLLTSVYQEATTFMNFSEPQTKGIDSKVKELNVVKSKYEESEQFISSHSCSTTLLKNKDHELNEARKQADEYREELRKAQDSLKEAHLKFNESSLATELLKNKNHELNEARKQAHEYLDELKKTQISLKEAQLKLNDMMPTNNPLTRVDPQVMLDGSLQDKQKQVNELKKLLDWGAKKQKETESELAETREQLQSFVAKSREMTQTKQKDMNKKLSEIQTLLLMKNPNYRPSCQIENESLDKEEKIFRDIKALIEYAMQSVKRDNNCKKNTTESAFETHSSSASLRASEYEVHLVTLIAAFLKITPFPVSSQTIYSYVANIDNVVDLQFVESLIRKFPSFFKEVAGVPGSMEKYWIYLDLKPVITI